MNGIYGIKNTVNGKIYVGKTTNSKDRFVRHRYLLNAGRHFNTYLQRSWDKYGKDAFQFEMLEECLIDQLPLKEQAWIDKLLPDIYNLDKNVADHCHDKNPFFGKTHTEETKNKMSSAKDGMYLGADNPNYGKKQTKEVKLKMSLNRSGKVTIELVLQIVDMLKAGEPHQQIADKTGVARTTVTRISNGTRWTNVTGGPVVPVIMENGIRVFSDLHRQRIGEKRKGHRHSEATKALISQKRKQMKLTQV